MKKIDVHAHTGKWLFEAGFEQETAAALAFRWEIEKAFFSSARTLMTNDLEQGNRETYEFVQNHEFAFMYVVMTPHDVNGSIRQLKRYAKFKKVVGVKLHPAQFRNPLTSQEHLELLRAVDDYGLPVLSHTTQASPLESPQLVGEVAVKFPEIRFIIAHFGGTLWRECIDVMRKCPNTYADITTSWLQYPMLEEGVREAGENRLLFGTDMTLLEPGCIVGCVETADITEKQKENIFYKNALKVFCLNK